MSAGTATWWPAASPASKDLLKQVRLTRGAFGSQLDPHSSWMIARSMETLVLRMEKATESGRKVADWLATNPHMKTRVLHPEFDANPAAQAVYERQCSGAGSTFSFVIDADRPTTFQLLNALQLFKLAVSLGGTESLVCHPALHHPFRRAGGCTRGDRRDGGAGADLDRPGTPGRPDRRPGHAFRVAAG